MNQKQNDDVRHLLRLALVSQEFEFVDIRLVDHWCKLREELGLAKLLLLIEQYVKIKTETTTQAHQTTNPNQNSDVVQ